MSAPPAAEGLPATRLVELSSADRRVARRCLVVLALLGSLSLIGVGSSLYLVNHHPLLLVALSPLERHLVLVAPVVDPSAFVGVAVLRRMAFFLPCFFLGRALGPSGIVWLEARAPRFARLVRWLERLFARAAAPVVFLLTGPSVSLLAGISGMRARRFLALAVAGLTARALVVFLLAGWLQEPIEAVRAWIDAYWIPGTVVLVATLLLVRLRRPGPIVPTV